MGPEPESYFDPTDTADLHERLGAELEATQLDDLACELTAVELASQQADELTAGHVDACEPCQHLVAGVEGQN